MKFTERATNLFYATATSSKKVRTLLTPIGATIFLIFTGSFIYLSLLLDESLNFPKLLSQLINIVVSVLFFVVGLFIYFWSVSRFLKAKGTPVPFNPPPRVVTDGPYAYCRNPMLGGIFLILFGLGTLLRSVSLVFIFTPLYIFSNALMLKAIEEPELAKRLGEHYINYKNSTPMFIPRWRRKAN